VQPYSPHRVILVTLDEGERPFSQKRRKGRNEGKLKADEDDCE